MKQNNFIYIILIFIAIILININWIYAVIKGNDLSLDEGYFDLGGSIAISESQNPFFYDIRAYGQPSEGVPYGKLSIFAFSSLLNFILHNGSVSFVLTSALTFLIMSFMLFDLLSSEFKLKKEISLFFTLLYLLSHPLLSYFFAHGHLRFLMVIFLPIVYLYIWFKIFNISITPTRRLALLFIISFVSLIFIFGQIIAFFLFLFLLMYTTPFVIKTGKTNYLKTLFTILIFTMPWFIIWIIYYKFYYLIFFNFEGFNTSNYDYFAMSQPLLNIFENIGHVNRSPLELQAATNPLLNIIYSLPFFLFLTFFITTNTKKNYILLILLLSVMFLASGIYGPFFAIFNEYNLPFRAPGRTFLPAAFPFLIIFGAIGANNLVKNADIRACGKFKILYVISILILFFSAYTIGTNYQYVYNINPKLHDAYSKIPAYNRIMMIPVWGSVGSGISMSYNGTYKYQPYPSVGYSVMNQDEYLAAEHNLKNAFSPPSPYEVPFLNLWLFSDFLWDKIITWQDYNGFYQHIKLLPNLKYLVIYKQILPQNIIDGLSKNPAVKTVYENEDLSILEIKNQTSNEIITSNKAFLLYTSSWRYGHSTLLTLLEKYNITYPIIFEATTPWYSLKPDQFDKNMTLVFNNIYSVEDMVLDDHLFNNKLKKNELIDKVNERNDNVSGYWQPSYDKVSMYLRENSDVSKTIDIESTGDYRVLVRTIYNGIWRGRYSVALDNKEVINYIVDKTRFGWGWITSDRVFLEKGKHDLKISAIEKYIDIDSIVLISEEEYVNATLEGNELNNSIDQKQCISGYEFEHLSGFENITEEKAISGGHIKPYSINGKINSTLYVPCKKVQYAVTLGNVSKLKINNILVAATSSVNGLSIYKLDFDRINETNKIQIDIQGDSLDALWLFNFNPVELYNISTQTIDTPKGYWGEYNFEAPPNSQFILLLKSYSPMFDIKYKNQKYKSYVSNIMLNGFYINRSEIFNRNNYNDNFSIELNYLNILRGRG